MASDLRILAAAWIIPVAGPPIRDGVVVVEGPLIAWVGPRRDLPSRFLSASARTFPESILLPGWVNAHCHLNLTAALGALPGSADRFTDWIRSLLALVSSWPPEIVRRSVVAGMDLLATTGTTTVAHVSTLPELEPILEHPMRAVVFHEPIGFSGSRARSLVAEAEEWLDAGEALIAETGSTRLTLGLAPHAPYSVSPDLYRAIGEVARRRKVPLSTHVAETRSEVEFLREGTGPFRPLLEERGAWDPSWTPPGASPVRYLDALGALEGAIAVHANYLHEQDMDTLRRNDATVVWCPGSHRHFGHASHPAPRLLEAGVRLALGTDSLASNAGLSMLREVRLAAESFPELDAGFWIHAATQAGADALGLGTSIGSLEEGKAADLQVLAGLPPDVKDPQDALLRANLRVRLVMVNGAEMNIR